MSPLSLIVAALRTPYDAFWKCMQRFGANPYAELRTTHAINQTRLFIFNKLNHCTLYPIDRWLSKKREQQHQQTLLYKNDSTPSRKILCVFSQFHAKGELADYCAYYLQQLQQAGCDIVLVSTSPQFTSTALVKTKRYCKAIIHRDNVGRDFYSYKVGIDYIGKRLEQYDQLVIANDSVFGPFTHLSNILHFGETHSLDVWGATDSFENGYHLQTYFIGFNKKVICSKAFKQWWHNVTILHFKQHIIDSFELPLASDMMQAGFRCNALWHYNTIYKKIPDAYLLNNRVRGKYCNPTIYFWDHLIKTEQFPFLKKEVTAGIKFNPDHFKYCLHEIQSVYDTNLLNQTH